MVQRWDKEATMTERRRGLLDTTLNTIVDSAEFALDVARRMLAYEVELTTLTRVSRTFQLTIGES